MWETEDTLAPTSTSWTPPADGLEPMSPTTSNFDDVGVLQKKLVPFTAELDTHLPRNLRS